MSNFTEIHPALMFLIALACSVVLLSVPLWLIWRRGRRTDADATSARGPVVLFGYCEQQVPRVGDKVAEINGKRVAEERLAPWELAEGELAEVVEVDKEGDFKLRNARGLVTNIVMFRKNFRYAAYASAEKVELPIKPYCGSSDVPATETWKPDSTTSSWNSDVRVNGAPVPAWMDVGIVSHMTYSVVAASQSVTIGDSTVRAQLMQRRLFMVRFSMSCCSFAENLLCYIAYFEARTADDRFYNKFEAYMLEFRGLDSSLLVIALLNTTYLVVAVAVFFAIGQDMIRWFATCRLPLSVTALVTCTMCLCFGEATKVASFACVLSTLLYLGLWLTHELALVFAQHLTTKLAHEHHSSRTRQRRIRYLSVALVLVVALVGGLVLLFCVDDVFFLHEESCPATENIAMPVRISGTRDWHCLQWGVSQEIHRNPDPTVPVFEALCSTTFHAFDRLVASETLPSRDVRVVRCPPDCQALALGSDVFGCMWYDASSAICIAAVHAGVLEQNAGGTVLVYGVGPPASGVYDRCYRNSITSKRSVAGAASAGVAANASFHFKVGSTRQLEMVTLHGWKQRSSQSFLREPWLRYVVDVSWFSGTTRREAVVLGPNADADIEVNFCHRGKTPVCTR